MWWKILWYENELTKYTNVSLNRIKIWWKHQRVHCDIYINEWCFDHACITKNQLRNIIGTTTELNSITFKCFLINTWELWYCGLVRSKNNYKNNPLSSCFPLQNAFIFAPPWNVRIGLPNYSDKSHPDIQC